MNGNKERISVFASNLIEMADFYAVIQEAMQQSNHHAWQVFVDEDLMFVEEGEIENYEKLMKLLSAASIADLSSSYGYWREMPQFPELEQMRAAFLSREAQPWFSPLPWHVRQWKQRQEDQVRYYAIQEAVNTKWHALLSQEAQQNFPGEEQDVSREGVIFHLNEKLRCYGFSEAKRNKEKYTWSKPVSNGWMLVWEFDLVESGIGRIGNHGVYSLSLRLFLKRPGLVIHDVPPRFKKGIQIPFEAVGPYMYKSYGLFKNHGQMKNVFDAKIISYQFLQGFLEGVAKDAVETIFADW